MINTDRQLARTKEQLALLVRGIEYRHTTEPAVHPLIADAAERALRSQADDLVAEIDEYEALRDGQTAVPDLHSVGQLHRNLVRARIAQGLSQADLARRVGVNPQQIQRYEATEYAGASLSRLQEIAAALGTPAPESTPGAVVDKASLVRRLVSLGLSSAVARRLVPGASRPQSFGQTAALAARALGLEVAQLLARDAPVLVAARPGFKMPANANAPSVAAYATYARVLAELVAAASTPGPDRLPASPDEIHRDLLSPEGVRFRDMLDYAWEHGVAVLPLRDPGAFHAALWDIDGAWVVVLKQGARTSDRWSFDLAHELCHAVDHVSGRRPLPDGIVDDESTGEWASDPDEQRANRFAGRTLLGPEADDLAMAVADHAGGRVDHLKGAVAAVAAAKGASAAALANYVAFRLAQQGINWWGAATNMQDREEDPWRIARDALLARLDFGALDELSRGLLIQALSE